MERRTLIKTALAGLLGPAAAGPLAAWAEAPAAGEGTPFDFEALVAQAEAMAGRGFEDPRIELAEPFAELSYDAMRGIRFNDELLFWGEGEARFAMDLMPPGFYFDTRLGVSIVRDGRAHEIPFSTDFFRFDPRYFPYGTDGRAPAGLATGHGFTGLRLRHPINREGVWDELAVFQGASYFRAVAADTFYGLSARGLAIGTGEPEPEEFPIFTRFFVEEPAAGADAIRLWTLLDSPSVAGAYEFTIRPGAATEMDIRLALFPRAELATVGIAPLTSMYFFGPESRRGVDDFRDAVHDSSGLAIVNGAGEHVWRPLINPPRLQFSAFQDTGPRRFGLMQRERDFSQYQDAEARYEMRPSAWVEPAGDWGAGAVILVEIPSGDEFADNIVAFWRPAAPLAAGARADVAYRLTWSRDEPATPLARVRATRGGGSILVEEERVFVVDFALGDVAFEDLAPRLAVSSGSVVGEVGLTRLPDGGARVGFHFLPDEGAEAEFRLELLDADGAPASEVWLYRWIGA